MRLTLGEYPYFIFARPFKNEKLMKFYSKREILQLVANKLGQLENIEEELDIDLITLFKALNSCWFLQISTKKIYGDIRPTLIFLNGWHLKPNLTELPMLYALKDYGKTWALTKEELL